MIKHTSAQCANNPTMRDYRTCYGDTFYSYYLWGYGYQCAAESTTSGVSAFCYSYQSCWLSTMTYKSGFRCYGYESCRGSTIQVNHGECTASLSCYGTQITTTDNTHPITCSGTQSCADAAIYGTNGLYVDFTGYLVKRCALTICLSFCLFFMLLCR